MNPNRSIRCQNNDGVSMTFGNSFAPFLLEDAIGIYGADAKVVTSENTMIDGSTYQSSIMKMRNIVLTLRDRPTDDHQVMRSKLYELFKFKQPGTLTFTKNGIERQIQYYVEEIQADAVKRARVYTISLICPSPFFEETSDTIVEMGGWEDAFTFPHTFTSAGETFGNRIVAFLQTIENTSAAENIGLRFVIDAIGPATNPSFTLVETSEHIQIGTESNPFTMERGDRLVITTGRANKHVLYTHEGTTTEINNRISGDSEFLQLGRGLNTFGYNADSGASNLIVTIIYRFLYEGI